MLKYMSDVRYAASQGDGWIRYDEEYRLRIDKSGCIITLGRVDTELWVLYVKAGIECCFSPVSQPRWHKDPGAD